MALTVQREYDPADTSDRSAFGPRLPLFDTPGATAYADLNDPTALLLIQKKDVPERTHIVQALKRLRNSALMQMREQKRVILNGEEYLMSVMTLPLGEPVMLLGAGKLRSVPDREIREVMLPQLLISLRALHEQGLTHRALHPGRLFYRNERRSEISIGECFTAPPGFIMPTAFETVERAMADPAGRGEGSAADDFYALGALLLSMLRGNDLLSGRTNEHLIQAKVTQGSLRALSGGDEVTGSIGNLLRGLLKDNADDRWGFVEVAKWMEGASPRVQPTSNYWALNQPVGFSGRNYSDRRALAQAMSNDIASASNYIKRQDLPHWVSHSFPETGVGADLVNLVLNGDLRQRLSPKYNTPDHQVARFCALLDPMGPVRFRGLNVMPDGIGPALAKAAFDGATGENIMGAFIGLTQGNLIQAISEIRWNACPEPLRASRIRLSLGKGSAHNEFENREEALFRFIYGQNPGLSCRSGSLRNLLVNSVDSLTIKLDQILQDDPNTSFNDPHIFGFLIAHDVELSSQYSDKLITVLPQDQQLTYLLEIFGEVQERYGLGPLTGLTAVLGARMEPQIRRMRSNTGRTNIEKRLKALVQAGNITALSRSFNIPRLVAADEQGWRRARQRIRLIDMTLQKLAKPVTPRDPRALYRGAQSASGLGALILAVTILLGVF